MQGSPTIIVVMGVSGSGKSSIGRLLTKSTGGVFIEGDEYHPAANIAKMSAGIALDDADRWPWLDRVAAAITAQQAGSDVVVCACSALKRRYRDRLRAGLTFPIHFICLTADRAVLQQRVAHRPGHYWPASLLDSQLEILELPAPDENSIVVSSELKPEAIVERVCSELGINHAWHG